MLGNKIMKKRLTERADETGPFSPVEEDTNVPLCWEKEEQVWVVKLFPEEVSPCHQFMGIY